MLLQIKPVEKFVLLFAQGNVLKKKMSKKTLILLMIVVLLQQQTLCASNPSPVKPYVNSMILSKPDLAYLYWNHTNTDIKQ